MKTFTFFFITFFYFCFVCTSQELNKIDKNAIYLVCRSTKSKLNIVARDFNVKDSLITHIGIAYLENNELKVYNVSNFKTNKSGSSLVSEKLESFLDIKDIVYFSIWRIQSNEEELNRLKSILSEFEKRTIHFDNSFELKDDNYYYCSEFVYLILKKLDSSKYNFSPITITLNSFYSKALRTEKFIYIPVDFFQLENVFEKMNEKKY